MPAQHRIIEPCRRPRHLVGRLAWSLVAVLGGLGACTAPGHEPVTIRARADDPDTRLTVHATQEGAIVEIASPSGMGTAHLELVSGPMPEQIIFRFHLKGLEELRFSYGSTTVVGSISSGMGHQVRESVQVASQGAGSAQPISPESPYWMEMRIVASEGFAATIPLQEGYIEALAPEDMLARGFRSFSLGWIDFFR